METDRNPSADSLRQHFLRQRDQKAPRRLQRDIVRDNWSGIVGLIRDDGATIKEVVAAVIAEGEPVLEDGFKAAIRSQIGTVKSIREGVIAGEKPGEDGSGSVSQRGTHTRSPASDIDNDFVSRPRRT